MKRAMLASILVVCGMLNPASANSHHRHHADHRQLSVPGMARGGSGSADVQSHKGDSVVSQLEFFAALLCWK